MCSFRVIVRPSTNNTNKTATCIVFLGESTQVKISYPSVYMGTAGTEIKFGTVSDYVHYLPSPPPS